ncbi:hypothetical protein DFH09DRAFT_396234 [Mycena vulgaris]|nr:hypothetical protein DFH09DRAFT_396234 [Mycena vulgaris]
MILSELCDRAKSAGDAQTMVDSSVFPLVDEVLASPDMAVRRSTCWMVGNLARHERNALVSEELCLRLVSALRGETLELKQSAASQLYWVTHPPDDAVHAIQLAWVVEFCSNVKRWRCHILASLACHATAQFILGTKAHQQLVLFLWDENINGMDIAANTLIWISRLPRGRAGHNEHEHPGMRDGTTRLSRHRGARVDLRSAERAGDPRHRGRGRPRCKALPAARLSLTAPRTSRL